MRPAKLEFAAVKKDKRTQRRKRKHCSPKQNKRERRMTRNNTKQNELAMSDEDDDDDDDEEEQEEDDIVTVVRMNDGRKGAGFDRHRMKRTASEANARAHTVIVISNPTQKSCAIAN